jgi:hypothetical protein
MPAELTIRAATPNEKKPLEELQRRSSLVWEESREALLAHPDAIDLPLEHIESGCCLARTAMQNSMAFSLNLPPGNRAPVDAS